MVFRQTWLAAGSSSLLKTSLEPDAHLQKAASAFAVAATCDGLAMTPVAELAAAAVTMAVAPPPSLTHTRRIIVPTHCLSGGTRIRRRRGRVLGGSGGDDEMFGGGGDDGWGGGGDWGGRDDSEEEGGDMAAGLQDLLLLWGVFCALAFGQTVWHVSPKPKLGVVAPPAFAALSYSGLKARLLSQGCH